jgi:hypothetical protein
VTHLAPVESPNSEWENCVIDGHIATFCVGVTCNRRPSLLQTDLLDQLLLEAYLIAAVSATTAGL